MSGGSFYFIAQWMKKRLGVDGTAEISRILDMPGSQISGWNKSPPVQQRVWEKVGAKLYNWGARDVYGHLTKWIQEEYEFRRERDVAEFLCIHQTIHSSLKNKSPTQAQWRRFFEAIYNSGKRDGITEYGEKLVEVLMELTESKNQAQLAKKIGTAPPTVANWATGKSVPHTSTLRKMFDVPAVQLVKPIVEFYAISPEKGRGGKWQIKPRDESAKALRTKLSDKLGIYLFYDSAGRVIYVGMTVSDLWREINQSLNGKYNRRVYMKSTASGGPKLDREVRQGRVAFYLSAYQISSKSAVKNIESFLLRAFANDHANTNIGKIRRSKKGRP